MPAKVELSLTGKELDQRLSERLTPPTGQERQVTDGFVTGESSEQVRDFLPAGDDGGVDRVGRAGGAGDGEERVGAEALAGGRFMSARRRELRVRRGQRAERRFDDRAPLLGFYRPREAAHAGEPFDR